MANVVYPKYLESLLRGDNDTILSLSGTQGLYAILIDTANYTYSSSHQYYTDLGVGTVGSAKELTGKTFTNGLLSADALIFPSITGPTVEAVVLYRQNPGPNTGWRLVAYVDTATGLPTSTITGAEVQVNWASGIFQL